MSGQMALEFCNRLPGLMYAADDYRNGMGKMHKETALQHLHIQHNSTKLARFIVFDVDHRGGADAWRDCGLPAPNIAVTNPANGHAHVFYELDKPVTKGDLARPQPLALLAAVEYSMLESMGADKSYNGVLSKNPIHKHWLTQWNHGHGFGLLELADFVPKLISPPKSKRHRYGVGRNETLHNDLVVQAYHDVREFKRKGLTQEQFYEWMRAEADRRNDFSPEFGGPLPQSEARSIAKSVTRRAWALTEEGFSRWQRARRMQGAAKQRAAMESAIHEAQSRLTINGIQPSMRQVALAIGTTMQNLSKNYRHLFLFG